MAAVSSGKKQQVILPKRQVGKVRSGTPYAGERGSDISNPYERFVEELSSVLRKRGDSTAIIRALAAQDGMMSTAVYSMVQIAKTDHDVIAYDSETNAASKEGTLIAQYIMGLMDTLSDYSKGFNHKRSINAVKETLIREVGLTGGCAGELVLNDQMLPDRIQVVAYNTLSKKSDGKGAYYPTQKASSGGEDVDLNIPTFFVAESNLEAEDAYAFSLFRAGLKQSFMLQEFLEDTRRGVRKTGHSRLVAKLITEQIAATASQETKNDPKKMAAYLAQVKADVETALAGIEPDDAVVSFDSVEFSVEDTGGNKSDYAPLLKLLSNMTGSSMKTPSSISGLRTDGSQSLSNAETLTYLKIAKSLTAPVEDLMSRILTLATRLYGLPVYVKFKMREIDLRPDSELEAYKTARQNRILQLLSFGLMDDVTARCDLGIRITSDMTELAGTGFYTASQGEPEAPVDRADAMGKDLNPGTPTKAGGSDQ